MCNMDCFKCSMQDCVNDDLTEEERKAQDNLDTEIIGSRKYGRQLTMWKYLHSEKGRATQRAATRRYNASEKGKERHKRYLQTEKGKEQTRKKRQRRIASGKNAESCRRYYQRKKEKQLRELFSGGME